MTGDFVRGQALAAGARTSGSRDNASPPPRSEGDPNDDNEALISSLVARWDGFLVQVKSRFFEVMATSRLECARVLENSGFDVGALGSAWVTKEGLAMDLQSRVIDTWLREVAPQLSWVNAPRNVVQAEMQKGYDFFEQLEIERERARVSIHATAARAACQRGTRSAGDSFCVHAWCEEASFDAWLEVRRTERASRVAKPATIHDLRAFERATIAYWRAYLGKRAALAPDPARALDDELRARLSPLYQALDREQAWISAGRPRQVV